MLTRSILGVLAAFYAGTALAMPQWAKEGQVRKGDVLYCPCVGEGPSLDLAREEAVKSCQGTAAGQLRTVTKVKSLLVQTQDDAGVHQEVDDSASIEGLVCKPLKESIEEAGDGFRVWIRCAFDLKAAKVIAETPTVNPHPLSSQTAEVTQRGDTKAGTYKAGESATMTIVSVPACSDVLIRGGAPRSVPCTNNPMSFVVHPGDSEIIIRAKGYKPKTVPLQVHAGGDENIQVFLDD